MNKIKRILYQAGFYYWSAWLHTSEIERSKHYLDRYMTIYGLIADAGLEKDFNRWKEIQVV